MPLPPTRPTVRALLSRFVPSAPSPLCRPQPPATQCAPSALQVQLDLCSRTRRCAEAHVRLAATCLRAPTREFAIRTSATLDSRTPIPAVQRRACCATRLLQATMCHLGLLAPAIPCAVRRDLSTWTTTQPHPVSSVLVPLAHMIHLALRAHAKAILALQAPLIMTRTLPQSVCNAAQDHTCHRDRMARAIRSCELT